MSRKFHVTIELEMPEENTEDDAADWGAGLMAYLPLPHPFNAKLLGAKEVAQPAPRKPGGG
jgi:hypothetical protein